MTFHQPDRVRYYTFPIMDIAGLHHAVFTRIGGYSQSPWAELNLGLTVGDDPEHVLRNKKLTYETMGRDYSSHFDCWLVHGDHAIVTDAPHPPWTTSPPKADIIITDKPEVTLYMRFADCVPILLFDPVKKVIGIAHAGWQGTVKNVPMKAAQIMKQKFGSRSGDIIAAIGPSIGPESYEVGEDVASQVRKAFGVDASGLLNTINSKTHLDLWQANRLSLEEAGIKHIQISGICTATNTQDWFSHRAENGRTGRFGVMVSLHNR